MRTKVLQGLLVAALGVALVWLAVDRSPEPLVATITALIGLLTLGSLGSRGSSEGDLVAASPDKGDRMRLAVLPLQNIAAAPGKEYFAAGLTEELISVLSRVRDLELIANSSSARYQEASPTSQVAEELGVGAILQGSVRSVGDELRISIRLTEASSERVLWSEDYDQKLEDVFAVQRDIAVSVAAALEVRIGEGEAARIGEAPTTDLEAYDLYLLARHDLNKRTEDGLLRSIDRFRAALDKDPTFAAAYAGLADAHVLATLGYAPIPKEVAFREARAAVRRALEEQVTLSDVHTSLGWMRMNLDRDWTGAMDAFERAIELNPSDARAHEWLAQCYSYQGRPEDAIPVARRAKELDPRSALIATEAGWPFVYLGRWEEAAAEFRKALELDPEFALAIFNLGSVDEAEGRLEEALAKYRKAADLAGGAPMFSAWVARALGLLGRREEAAKWLEPVIEAAEAGAPVAVYLAHAYDGLAEDDEVLRWLQRAVDADEPLTLAIGSTWMPFDRLKGDRRFEAICAKIPQRTLAWPLDG